MGRGRGLRAVLSGDGGLRAVFVLASLGEVQKVIQLEGRPGLVSYGTVEKTLSPVGWLANDVEDVNQ